MYPGIDLDYGDSGQLREPVRTTVMTGPEDDKLVDALLQGRAERTIDEAGPSHNAAQPSGHQPVAECERQAAQQRRLSQPAGHSGAGSEEVSGKGIGEEP